MLNIECSNPKIDWKDWNKEKQTSCLIAVNICKYHLQPPGNTFQHLFGDGYTPKPNSLFFIIICPNSPFWGQFAPMGGLPTMAVQSQQEVELYQCATRSPHILAGRTPRSTTHLKLYFTWLLLFSHSLKSADSQPKSGLNMVEPGSAGAFRFFREAFAFWQRDKRGTVSVSYATHAAA